MGGLKRMKVNFDDLVKIYEREIKINTKNKEKVYRFDRFKMLNLTNIYDILVNNKYSFVKYNIFLIRHPKYRIVMSLNIKDKIINHYVTRFILMPKLEKYLDIRNVATRKNMGHDYGIKMVKKYLEAYKHKPCYVLKLDISKYFYSIDHQILKNMIKEHLTLEENKIINTIIDSTNYCYINEIINNLKNNELKIINKRQAEVEKIPLYLHGKGLPIGNMSSQFLSIFYLNKLDHEIIHDFHFKHYLRYMDDMIIFSDDISKLKEISNIIEQKLSNEYLLQLNKQKTNITSIKQGFNFCGYRFRVINNKTIIQISRDTYKRVKKRIKEVKYLYCHDKLSLQSAFSSINNYYYGFKYSTKRKNKRLVEYYFF